MPESACVSYGDYADKLEHELGLLDGVREVRLEGPFGGELRVLVILDESADWNARQNVVGRVDQFARQFVRQVGVDLQIMDPVSAEHITSCA